MNPGEAFVNETIKVFRQYKELAERAMEQLDDTAFFRESGPRSPSAAMIVKHVAGNLKSRWTDFLTTDGEKPDRNRDSEFEISARDTRESLGAFWEEGWNALFASLESLRTADLEKTITIRGEPHSVPLAVQRSLAHTSYHAGQITYVSRLSKEGDWKWLTIAPGKSKEFNREMETRTRRK